MNQYILDLINYVTVNFDFLRDQLILIIAGVYILYGALLALDARKRYQSSWAPVIIFACWVFFSIIFLPIYIVIRPERLVHDKLNETNQKKALILGSGLVSCPKCEEVNHKNDTYCSNCGEKLVTRCTNCHREIELNWKFCTHCGGIQTSDPVNNNLPLKIVGKYHSLTNYTGNIMKNLSKKDAVISQPEVKTETPAEVKVEEKTATTPDIKNEVKLEVKHEILSIAAPEKKLEEKTEVIKKEDSKPVESPIDNKTREAEKIEPAKSLPAPTEIMQLPAPAVAN